MADFQNTDEFSEDEKRLLLRFVTNVDKRVFVLRNLPEVIKGAMFSRYSRTTKGLRRLLMDEFIKQPEKGFGEIVAYAEKSGIDQSLAIKKAQAFYDRILDGYGDDSIGELGGAHLAIENISNIATKFIQDRRIGGSPLEKSTRYIFFNDKVQGKFLYCREPDIMLTENAEIYQSTCDMLFEVYSELLPKMIDHFVRTVPRQKNCSENAYNFSIKAKACDSLRGLLPAGTLTNMGIFGNGRFFDYLVARLRASKLAELQQLADEIHEELSVAIPSFVRRSEEGHKHMKSIKRFLRERESALADIASRLEPEKKAYYKNTVELVWHDPDAETKILAAVLYEHSSMSLQSLQKNIREMTPEQKKEILKAALGNRENRRHKPGRGFENAMFTFEITADYGAYRDLHRHRILTQDRQVLDVEHGFEIPEEVMDAGYGDKYIDAMVKAASVYKTIKKRNRLQAQYIVPFGYRIRWYMSLNLRALYWLCELRSQPQGHTSYRRIAMNIWKQITELHPLLGDLPNFVDLSDPILGRLEQEKKTEEKKIKMQ